jgi:CHAT domain-containing protein/tetratricopeptide (TPR) repeat protein
MPKKRANAEYREESRTTKVRRLVALTFAILWILGWSVSCSRRADPNKEAAVALEHAEKAFFRGKIAAAKIEAERGYERFRGLNADWGWKFMILEARALSWRSMHSEVLTLLNSNSTPLTDPDLSVRKQRLLGAAFLYQNDFGKAEQQFRNAESICAASHPPACVDLPSAWAWFEMDQEHYAAAQELFTRALAANRQAGDHFLEADALMNLGWCADEQTHWDEALDWSNRALEVAQTASFDDLAETALGNIALAYYKLGDPEKAEGMFIEAKNQAHALKDGADETAWLANAGYIRMDQGDNATAQQFFLQSLEVARSINSPEDIGNAFVALASVSVQTGALDDATRYANEALSIARTDRRKDDEDFARLVQGQIAAKQHDSAAAEAAFHEVEQSGDSPVFLKWDAEHSHARLYEDENQMDAAASEYRIALSTFEGARSELQREASKLTFLSNASAIYDDYIHFLIVHGKTDEALQVAEFERGRTLSEGLGLLDANVSEAGPGKSGVSKSGKSQSGSAKTIALQKTAFKPGVVDPQATARRAGGTILFYALGEKQSYLWAISPQKTSFFTLPPKSEIDPTVQRYGKVLANHQEFIAGKDARTLYQTLVAPAQALLPKDATVFIIPDGSLNMLNFETLQVDEPGNPEPHYWIEDATIADASSLRMLGASRSASPQRLKPQLQEVRSGTAGSRALPNLAHPASAHPNFTHTAVSGSLLLMGNAVAASADYPELREASVEIKSIEKHFPEDRQQVFARERATPAAYLASNPDRFSYIHFVAHGTASRTSPLDSAIVLSSTNNQEDSFKLYARDIIRQSLHAQLVTISACYGAGVRAYSGEGLVGLSWAFLHAGSHNVIGALWEVSDESTPQLMDALYDGLSKGQSPASALRAAKLSLLHSNKFNKPFYWAPFQLYTGL